MLFKKKKESKEKVHVSEETDRLAVASVAPNLFLNNFNYTIVNNEFVRMIVAAPSSTKFHLNWGQKFMNFGGLTFPVSIIMRHNNDIDKYIDYTNNEVSSKKWNAEQVNETLTSRRKRELRGEQAFDAAELIARTNAKLIEFYILVKVTAPTLEQLEMSTKTVMSYLRKGYKPEVINAGQEELFWMGSCFMSDFPALEQRYNYSAPIISIAAGLFNKDVGIYDPLGVPLGKDDSGSSIRLDMLSKSETRINSNLILNGDSGCGKTTLLQALVVYWYVLNGCRIYMNDIEGTFINLTRALGGEVSSMDDSSSMLISPFQPRNFGASATGNEEQNISEGEEIRRAREKAMKMRVLSSQINFLVSYLMQAFDFDKSTKSLLYHACALAYGKYGFTDETTFAEYYRNNMAFPCLADVFNALPKAANVLEGNLEDAVYRIRNSFRKAIDGPEAFMWDVKESKVKDSQLMCIDMQGLSNNESMMKAQYYNLLSWEWTQITTHRFSEDKTIVITDELQSCFTPDNLAFCSKYADMYRRARKYGAGMISAFQEPKALYADGVASYGTTLVSNSAYYITGEMSETLNQEAIKKMFSATDETMDRVASCGGRKFLVKIGSEKQSWLKTEFPQWMLDSFGKANG